jgi:outer membrane lipoprotein SlyB
VVWVFTTGIAVAERAPNTRARLPQLSRARKAKGKGASVPAMEAAGTVESGPGTFSPTRAGAALGSLAAGTVGGNEAAMLEITALAVSAVATAGTRRTFTPDEVVEVTWRHYPDDPETVFFIDVDVTSMSSAQEHAVLMVH